MKCSNTQTSGFAKRCQPGLSAATELVLDNSHSCFKRGQQDAQWSHQGSLHPPSARTASQMPSESWWNSLHSASANHLWLPPIFIKDPHPDLKMATLDHSDTMKCKLMGEEVQVVTKQVRFTCCLLRFFYHCCEVLQHQFASLRSALGFF